MSHDAASAATRQTRPHPLDSPRQPALHKRLEGKSLRLRPTEVLDNAEPPSPLKDASVKSVSTSTVSSKMSLFNLFSRPKVERARGHSEKTPEPPPVPRKNTLKSSASTPNLVLHVQANNAVPPTSASVPPPEPYSKSSSRRKLRDTSKPPTRDRKPGSFDPPPLFQAYPQSIKDGTVELAQLPADKSRKAGSVRTDKFEGADETGSVDTRRSTMAALKHVASSSITQIELPKKIFVLVTSGYLLQYAETGPSDRLPEKMLHLGKNSATFACDVVTGKHHVLQVSHEVDQNGITVAQSSSSSIFSKLGMRGAAARRLTSSFILVMPDAQEMEAWMTAIRKEIEMLGGARIPMGSTYDSKNASENETDLKKTPSQSHRYNVRRNPSKVSSITSPKSKDAPPVPSPPPKTEKDTSDTATIDGIEMEASKLATDEPLPTTRTRSPSDAPSMSSSAAVSVEQQQLDTLRSSGSNKRMSYASQAGTVATTVTNSRANSVTG